MDIRTEAIRNLTQEIPLNDYGLPIGIYRVDLLPFHDYQHATNLLESDGSDEPGEVKDLVVRDSKDYRIAGFPASSLQNAFMPLQYDEGFPALGSGLPFWSRMEFEPADAHEAFLQYLAMNRGAKATNEEEDPYNGREASGTRSIAAMVAVLHSDQDLTLKVEEYQDHYHTYYWGLRAHAYDIFRVAQYRKSQELRAVETQGEHYFEARRLRTRLMQYMDSEEEFWDLMSPKVAMDMFTKVTTLERISAGMPGTGPPTGDAKGTPFEVVIKQVAQTNRRAEGHTIDEEGQILDVALEDEGTTEVLQELIIRAGVSK